MAWGEEGAGGGGSMNRAKMRDKSNAAYNYIHTLFHVPLRPANNRGSSQDGAALTS